MDYTNSRYQKDIDVALSQTINLRQLAGKKVLITGATGLIGSFVIDMLLKWNQTVDAQDQVQMIACGRNIGRLEQRFSYISDKQNLQFTEYDVNEAVNFDFPVDYIIHAASNAFPAAFQSDPVGTMLSNFNGTRELLNYGMQHGMKRFLFVSTGEVYGQGDPAIDAFVEDYSGYVNPMEVRSCYPISKRAAETLCVSYGAQYGVDTVVVRPSHTYGPNTTSADNRANVQFVNDVVNGRDIVMKSAGSQLRSYTYIADAASALLTVLLNGETGQAYNIANPDARITIAGFAETLAELGNQKVVFEIPNEIEKGQQTPITKAVLDSKKLEGLGWKGSFDVKTGLESILEILMQK